MTDERNLRWAEFQRLRRRSYWITGSALAIAVSSWMLSGDWMIDLAHSLMRRFSLRFDTASLLLTPIFFLIAITGVIIAILAVKNGAAVRKLGCVECGAPRPFVNLWFHRNCLFCGSRLQRTL
jgi:hypothetical protein